MRHQHQRHQRRTNTDTGTAAYHDHDGGAAESGPPLPPFSRSARYLAPVGSRVLPGWSGWSMVASVQAVSYSSGLR